MKLFPKIVAALAAAGLILTGQVDASAQTRTVYDTPGVQRVNDRDWNTTCERYSSTVIRCASKMWVRTVTGLTPEGNLDARYQWVHNNITYLASPETNWKNNPLGRSGEWTDADGRRWKTECHTPATGKGACRTYVWVKRDNWVSTAQGIRNNVLTGWVFNNMVQFSSTAVPHVKTIPSHALDGARLTMDGLGALSIDTSLSALEDAGYIHPADNDATNAYTDRLLTDRGVHLMGAQDKIDEITLTTNQVSTEKGAKVGMTIGQVKALYPAAQAVQLENYWGVSPTIRPWVLTVKQEDRMLAFVVESTNEKALTDASVVRKIVLKNTSWTSDTFLLSWNDVNLRCNCLAG